LILAFALLSGQELRFAYCQPMLAQFIRASEDEGQRSFDLKLFHFFFIQMTNMDLAARQAEAHGGNGSRYRTMDSRAAGLTDEQGAQIIQTAVQCFQELQTQDMKWQALIDQRRAEKGNSTNLLSRDEQARMLAERDRTLEEHISYISDLLGSDDFERLKKYLAEKYGSKVT
jgi:hypothetical protein